MLQAGICLRYMEETLRGIDGNPAVFLCGDFNSTPECGVLEFVRKGVIGRDHAEWNAWKDMEIRDLEIRHPFKMDTACGTPKYTNYTIGFKDCLDYIFYETNRFRVSEVIPFPSEEELEVHKAIPNVVFPSDHIACVADLKWEDSGVKD